MDDRDRLRERLAGWLDHLAHTLPGQAPIRDFVHHNTLHGFQHRPFPEALQAAAALTGARPYWPEARFRDCFAAGRIDRDDLAAALADAGEADLDAPVRRGLSRRDVLVAALLADPEVPGPARRDWLRRESGLDADPVFAACAALTATGPAPAADWRARAAARVDALFDRLGRDLSWRGLLEHLSGEDVLETVRGILQRHLAAHLDLGVAAWRNPARGRGFFAAWKASAGCDLRWEMDELPDVGDAIRALPDDPLAVLAEALPVLLPDPALWYGYLERLCLELPGWSGMFLRRQGAAGDAPVAMADYLAVRVALERLLCAELAGPAFDAAGLRGHYATAAAGEFLVRDAVHRGELPETLHHRAAACLAGGSDAWDGLAAAIAAAESADASFVAAWRLAGLARALGLGPADLATLAPVDARALLETAGSLAPARRSEVWLLAYEGHYRERLLAALAANGRRRRAGGGRPAAQVVACMDDREEGTRRHLEEVAPDIETYGAAGFLGIAMYWQGIDDAVPVPLCPVAVKPRHRVAERAAAGAEAALAAHAARRERRLRWRERLYQATRRHAVGGTLIGALAGLPALAALGVATLAPTAFGRALRRWRQACDGPVVTVAAIAAGGAGGNGVQDGFTDAEQVDRVATLLRTIGLVDGFAPLVLLLGHGSSSANNPHRSAYDCGACAGRHGGPNARVGAAMANRPAVRAGLAARGIAIPDDTWFVAAEHDTCDDSIEWYDLAAVPTPFQPALDRLLGQVAEACRAHAVERCRRLASAPVRPTPWRALRHLAGRAADLAQARPELGHATNAAAFIGRRAMSRGLFLDRRVFLISYDPAQDDAAGHIVEATLLSTAPVGAGISLEYYFSTVDNERFGCGSKTTHNIAGLFGVMEGADSDLRTGLPLQMVEIHEPMRLLVVVEQRTAVLDAIVARQPALRELISHAWINLAAQHPDTGEILRYCPRRGWLPWAPAAGAPPRVARSIDWFAGERDALPPALLLGGNP